jgi:hypothetical protein
VTRALAQPDGALHVNLTVPTTQVRLGPLSFDGLQVFLGVPLADVLSPLMRAPRHQRPGEGGAVLDVYPLAIPDGEGLSIPVKLLGDIGFRAFQGLLVIIVPAAVAEVLRQQLAEDIAAKQAAGPRFVEALGGGGYVAEFAVRLRPWMRKAVPLGKWGEIGVEAGS